MLISLPLPSSAKNLKIFLLARIDSEFLFYITDVLNLNARFYK